MRTSTDHVRNSNKIAQRRSVRTQERFVRSYLASVNPLTSQPSSAREGIKQAKVGNIQTVETDTVLNRETQPEVSSFLTRWVITDQVLTLADLRKVSRFLTSSFCIDFLENGLYFYLETPQNSESSEGRRLLFPCFRVASYEVSSFGFQQPLIGSQILNFLETGRSEVLFNSFFSRKTRQESSGTSWVHRATSKLHARSR